MRISSWRRLLALSVLLLVLLQGCTQIQDMLNPPEPSPPVEDNPDNTWDGSWDPNPTAEFTEAICRAVIAEGAGEGAALQTDLAAGPGLELSRFSIDSPVLAPAVAGAYPHSPSSWQNRYAPVRTYHPFACGSMVAAAWQSGRAGQVQLTAFSTDGSAYGTLALPTSRRQLIAADFRGRYLYYMTTGPARGEAEADLDLRLHRFDLGAEDRDSAHQSRQVDTSRAGLGAIDGENSWQGHASLRHDGERLVLVLAHLMHRSADGLNHQRGVAAMFDPQTLALQANLGQISGHSFEHRLATADDRGVLLVDIGDNYPRGVHLHRIGAGGIDRRVVYTFKTLHGTVPQSPAGVTYPRYEQISNSETDYFRWSNDNATYTELGAAIEVSDGIAVFFVGEPAPDGRALDSSRVGDYLNDSRNVGFVLVRHDFQNADPDVARNWVPDDLVLSEPTHSANDTGGFYTFGGIWEPQRNAGVRWLTGYSEPGSENATRLRVVELEPDVMLAVWEVWSRDSYVDTRYMIVDAYGSVTSGPHSLSGTGPRVARADEVLVLDGRAWFLDGAGDELVITSAGLAE